VLCVQHAHTVACRMTACAWPCRTPTPPGGNACVPRLHHSLLFRQSVSRRLQRRRACDMLHRSRGLPSISLISSKPSRRPDTRVLPIQRRQLKPPPCTLVTEVSTAGALGSVFVRSETSFRLIEVYAECGGTCYSTLPHLALRKGV